MTEMEMLAEFLALGIAFTMTEHDPVMTVEDSADLYLRLPGLHSKNLFLKDAGGRFWLVTVPASSRPDLKALATAMGAKKLSFGKSDDLLRLLGLAPGSVTPLGACNDTDGTVTLVLDQSIADAQCAYFHPNRNTATIGIAGADLVSILVGWNHVPKIINVPMRID